MSEETGGYWRGLVTGVIVGAAAAMLLTPKSGGKADAAHLLADDSVAQAELIGDDANDALTGTLDNARESAQELAEYAKSARDATNGV